MKKIFIYFSLVSQVFLFNGCIYTKSEVDVKPVEIKPMHITIDVNVKVEKQLDDFFGDLDKKAETLSAKDKVEITESDSNIIQK
ncbi:MAG TPA: hypothetical protein DD381_09655 [Lentisphaeria bacterium]|nr:MAG: hypothetical protein A2X47_07530 [Lentisphaerae bacterium GWF2_38_69]HBM16589.1 hypothetical protein [Lentisphaeria bacterium]